MHSIFWSILCNIGRLHAVEKIFAYPCSHMGDYHNEAGRTARGNICMWWCSWLPWVSEAFVLHVLDPVMEESGESMQQLPALPSSVLTGTPARRRFTLTDPSITRPDADREYVSCDPQQPRAKVAHLVGVSTMTISIFCLNSLGICSQSQLPGHMSLFFGQVDG